MLILLSSLFIRTSTCKLIGLYVLEHMGLCFEEAPGFLNRKLWVNLFKFVCCFLCSCLRENNQDCFHLLLSVGSFNHVMSTLTEVLISEDIKDILFTLLNWKVPVLNCITSYYEVCAFFSISFWRILQLVFLCHIGFRRNAIMKHVSSSQLFFVLEKFEEILIFSALNMLLA